jgi:hypothetical protein
MDYDGTPMVTDVMHNETAIAFAQVLADRNDGFTQMTYLPVSGSAEEVMEHFEEIAEISGRPILFNVVQASDRYPERHRGLLAWLERCRAKGLRIYGQGVTSDAGFAFTLKDWNLGTTALLGVMSHSAPWKSARRRWQIPLDARRFVKIPRPSSPTPGKRSSC